MKIFISTWNIGGFADVIKNKNLSENQRNELFENSLNKLLKKKIRSIL